jgi:DNA-binding NtrC family response regulator
MDNDFKEEIDGLATAMDIQEKRFILKALSQYRWHKDKTEDTLKIDPKTLYTKMK